MDGVVPAAGHKEVYGEPGAGRHELHGDEHAGARRPIRPSSTRAASSSSSGATSRATRRRWWRRSAASRAALFLQVAETLCAELRPRADRRLLLRGRLDPAHGGRAEHPHRRHPPAPARQHRAARRRDHGAARPRLDPGLDRHPDAATTCCPGYLPMPHAVLPDRGPRPVRRTTTPRPPGGGASSAKYVGLALQGLVRRAPRRPENDFLLRPAPAALRQPLAHDHRVRDGRRQGEGLLRDGREPDRGLQNGALHRAGLRQARLAGGPRLHADRDRRVLARPRRRSTAARCGPRTSGPRSSSCPPRRTPRRTARSPTPSACSSGTSRRSSRRATAAASSPSCSTWAGGSRRSTPARPPSGTAPSRR